MKNPVRTIAFTSGKGGVGKTNTVINLGLSLVYMGKKVLIIDADLGLANVDVLLGLFCKYNTSHVFSGDKTLNEIIIEIPQGLLIIPASSGIQELTELDYEKKLILLNEIDSLNYDIDFLFIDTAPGISSNVMYFNIAAQERVLIVTPEPSSLTDAYATIKVLSTKYKQRYFKLIVNWVPNSRQAKEIYGKLTRVVNRFLNGVSIEYLGFIPYDESLKKAVARQKPVVDIYPNCYCSKKFIDLARNICQQSVPSYFDGNIKFFWKRLLLDTRPLDTG